MTEKSNQSLTKRGFNLPHVFDRSVIILLVAYGITLLYELWALIEYETFVNFSNYYGETFNMSQITFAGGLIVSLVQFRFLQVKPACITVLSFGESRKSLFRKKFWFPLLTMVLMTISFYIVHLCTDKKLKSNFAILADEYFANLLIALLPLIVGYTVGAFSRIMSGKTSETIFFGVSVSALPFSVFNLIDGVFALSLRGYYTPASEWDSLSGYIAPEGQGLIKIFSLFDPLYTLNTYVFGFGKENMSLARWFETPIHYIIKNLIWICLFICFVFIIENYFVEKFKAENCDKAGKNKIVRVLCALSPSLLATALVSLLFYQETCVDIENYEMFALLVIALLASLIGTLLVTMAIYRRKDQFKYSFLGVGIASIFSFIVATVSVTGCFGYSTYMPDTDKIKSVMINDCIGLTLFTSSDYVATSSEYLDVEISFKTDKEIELVKDIHSFIANDKNYETTEQFTIIYELENGDFVNRTYPYLSKASCEKISFLWKTDSIRSFYKTVLNQNPEINSASTKKEWFAWMNGFGLNNNINVDNYIDYVTYKDYYYDATSLDTIAKADSLVLFSKDNIPAYITNEQVSQEVMEKLKKALYEDYMSISAEQFYKPWKEIGVISLASCSELLKYSMEYWDEETEGKPTFENVLQENGYDLFRFSVTTDMVNTIRVLKDADLYKHLFAKKKIQEAHLIEAEKFLSWFVENEIELHLMPKDENNKHISAISYYWDGYNNETYFVSGCQYLAKYSDDADSWDRNFILYEDEVSYKNISESDIQIITPEEAEKLREKAFMTYNAGNDCKFLVMKYTDGTANMLVIPE